MYVLLETCILECFKNRGETDSSEDSSFYALPVFTCPLRKRDTTELEDGIEQREFKVLGQSP